MTENEKLYHSALSRCAEQLDNMRDVDPITDVPDFLAAKLKQCQLVSQSQAAQSSEWQSLSDVQWMNIVNHDHAYYSFTKDEAVHEAVKRTEAKLKELNAAHLAVQSQAAPVAEAVPEGWQFVPIVPTQAMNTAGYMRNLELGSAKRSADETYKAMLAAAPQAPTAQEVTQQAAPESWISVDDEQKPEVGKPVLLFVRTAQHGEDDNGHSFTTEGEEVAMGEYCWPKGWDAGTGYFDCYTSPMSDNDWITHWMPLPSAPEQPGTAGATKGGEDKPNSSALAPTTSTVSAQQSAVPSVVESSQCPYDPDSAIGEGF